MYFGQKVHPLCFDFPQSLTVADAAVQLRGRASQARVTCDDITPHAVRLRLSNAAVADPRQYSDGILDALRAGTPVAPVSAAGAVTFAAQAARVSVQPAGFSATFAAGGSVATDAQGLGFNGRQSYFSFALGGSEDFYGFGERTKGLNKRGDSFDFWTVDVVAVLPHTYMRADYDPSYVSIPLAICRSGSTYFGLYFDNPDHLIMDVGRSDRHKFMVEAMDGHTDLYLIAGPTLADVVRHFSDLTGRGEVPPVWALGYHQCRWGYKTEGDLRELEANFRRHQVPVSVLWYDIDYMDGYRVFTWDKVDFPDPKKLNTDLKHAGIRTVTIVDPGVKLDPGYAAYDSGKAANVYCKTHNGMDYVGTVWPGNTVFPDFTLPGARDWWAAQLAAFIRDSALDGAWLDMNDPATGASAYADMLFEHGQVPHAKYHNQYGHFMARASRQAFDQLQPNGRPFLLTRSGATGTQRYSAIWTGDNCSNWDHLKMSIPETLNLGLSGVAFNGPDVAGFMGDTNEKLMIRWYQAGFLFPFFRNHSCIGTRQQEPWTQGERALALVRDTIVTRYRLMPYLYTLFFQHYLSGDPVMRPLAYHYDDPAFASTDDQYLIGDALMVAPLVTADDTRYVHLPAGWWYDLRTGEWLAGGQIVKVTAALGEVPLYVRDGAVLPYFNGTLKNADTMYDAVELHVFTKAQPARLTTYIDHAATRDYQRGQYNEVTVAATLSGTTLAVQVREKGPLPTGTVRFHVVAYGHPAPLAATLNGVAQPLAPATRRWVSKDVPVLA